MTNGDQGYPAQGGYDSLNNQQLRDLEEKQRILKDRLLLIGKNLIETKEQTNSKILEIKKSLKS